MISTCAASGAARFSVTHHGLWATGSTAFAVMTESLSRDVVIPGHREAMGPETIITGRSRRANVAQSPPHIRLWLWIPGSAFQAAPG